MAWTSPRTWVDGETVTAALMNTHVRDNLNALKSRIDTALPYNITTSSSGFSSFTTSTFLQVLSLSLTYSHATSHNLLIYFMGAYRHSSATGELRFTFELSGDVTATKLGDATYGIHYAEGKTVSQWQGFTALTIVTQTSASSRVIKPFAATNGSTLDVGFGYVQFGYVVMANTL